MIAGFLLDQGLPRSACSVLRQWGYDAQHVADVGMSKARDSEILRYARDNRRVVVTLDADFHRHLALDYATEPSTIRIRIEGLKAPDLAAILRDVCTRASGDIEAGCAITIDEIGARIRRLPIGRRTE